jgi:deoxyhypusine synthase
MLNEQLISVFQGCLSCGDLKGIKFAYALNKNKRLIKKEVNRIYDIVKPSEKYLEYDKKRIDMAKKHAKVDENGEPLVENEKYVMKNKRKFNSELKKLQEEYGDAFKEQQEKERLSHIEWEKECDINFHKISEKDIPKNISPAQLEFISAFMVDETED